MPRYGNVSAYLSKLMTTSIIDQPALKSANEDQLNMKAYSDALVEFINGAQTPLTIALQGEWGSGKTSLMNALKRELVDDDKSKFLGVWINTWQYSLMSDSNEAIVQILRGIVQQLPAPSENEIVIKKSAMKQIGGFLKMSAVALTNVGAKTIGFGENLGSEFVKQFSQYGADDAHENDIESGEANRNQIEVLKDRIQSLVNSAALSTGKRGFVFFIDDLDRIDPPVAVQILELLKNIFDLDKCIFVLAIDYGVVVTGLKSKFGEMTISNEREFRSFFDKIIQLPFAMPVNAYCIDQFLMDSPKTIGYVTEEESRDNKLSKIFTDYALESVGTNPRSLKRLINSLSLMRLLVKKTVTKDDDFDFDEWKDVVFALECIKIQYPQVHFAIERFCGFNEWGAEFAQTLGLAVLSKDESEKLKISQGESFDEEWEQMLFALCKKDPFLASRALNISLMLNQIKARIEEKKENVEDIVGVLLKLSSVTTVKSEPVAPIAVQTFNAGEMLKTLRGSAFGMNWRETEKKNPYWGTMLDDTVSVVSWQKRVQSNLACEFVISRNVDNVYLGECWMQCTMRFETNGGQIALKMWGEFWGCWEDGKHSNIDFTLPDVADTLTSVESKFTLAWSPLGIKGNIGHHEKNLWFNVTIPIRSMDTLKDGAFSKNLCASFASAVRSLVALKPYCVF